MELLPTLANALCVTMDGLFGLQEGQGPDVGKLLYQHIGTLPMDQRLERLCQLIWVGALGDPSAQLVAGAGHSCPLYPAGADRCSIGKTSRKSPAQRK